MSKARMKLSKQGDSQRIFRGCFMPNELIGVCSEALLDKETL